MASRGSCKRVWLCSTEDKADICYRHYHNCWMAAGHVGDCDSASGPGHDSAHRVGNVVNSVTDAYREMHRVGWED